MNESTKIELGRARAELEAVYEEYNRRECVHPDPLELVTPYDDRADREVAALAASALAYGRVTQILANAGSALDRLGESPAECVGSASREELLGRFEGFRHRFTTGAELAALLHAAGRVRRRYGSLERCFAAGLDDDGETVREALTAFVGELVAEAGEPLLHLLPSPARGSACKRLNLFLRWLVRRDAVDPGGWGAVPAARLIVPVDTHMHRVGLALGMTARRSADLRAALEITAGFRAIAPADPVRYDFALTRLGMRGGGRLAEFLRRVGGAV
ncbi:MAG: TIGR02757 family protein [Planctomycetota bacterium]